MTLIDYIKENHSSTLVYIDGDSGVRAKWEEISCLQFPLSDERKKLAFLYLDNSIISVSILFSMLRAGNCICLLNQNLETELKEGLESKYHPSYIFDTKREEIRNYRKADVNGLKDLSISVFYTDIYKYIVHHELCILLPTSGTTGSPKLVKLTDENLIANATSVIQYLPITPADSTPLNLPIYYSYGLSILLTNSIAGGQIICTNESILSRNFWNLFMKYQCNNFSGVPYTYEMLDRIGFSKMEGLNLKYFTQAGGKLDTKYRIIFGEYAAKHDARFFIMYGQTEAAPRMAFLDPQELFTKIESIGKAIAGGKFEIDSANGELTYQGKNIFRGYALGWSDLDHLEVIETLRTGDLSYADDEGFYYISGRLNRFVKLFGNRIGLDEVEQRLRKKFECTIGCTGVNDQFILVVSDSEALSADDVKTFLSTLFGIHASAIRFRFVHSIPLNSNHKIDYPKILTEYGK